MLTVNRFPQIAAEIGPKVEAAVAAGRQAVALGAQARVPVASGDLRAAIHVDGDAVVAGDSDVFYGHLVEFGTSRTPPRPFLVPSLEASRAEILAGVAAALRGL